MTSKFGYSARYEKLAKDLIYNVLGFNEDHDENFITSMDYVMSNFLYHHYMDVNEHQIQRSLQGISFKMIVHGHQKKAEQLQALIDKFLSSPILEDKGDLKWSILSVLNELSQHPARDSLSASFVAEIQNSLEASIAKETVETDWLKELMERSFHLQDKDETLSEWSDDDEMKLSFSLCTPANLPHRYSIDKVRETFKSETLEDRERRNVLLKDTHLARSWLTNTLQRCYWLDESAFSGNGFEVPELTEYVVMRECLWVLVQPSSGYIFKLIGGEFILRPVSVLSLTQESLYTILKPFASAASKLVAMDKWLKDVESLSVSNADHLSTFQAYADGLRTWRTYFHKEVNNLEEQIFTQEGCQTLLWLLNALEPLFSNLCTIYNVHTKAFEYLQETLLHKSMRLLSLLIQGVESGVKKEDQKCLLQLFQFAIKNYLKIFQSILWGSGSPRSDFLEQLGIARNRYSEALKSKNFYDLQALEQLELPGLNFLCSLRRPLMEICELKEVVQNMPFEENCEADYLEKLVEERIRFKYFEKRPNIFTKSIEDFEKIEENNNFLENSEVFETRISKWFTEDLSEFEHGKIGNKSNNSGSEMCKSGKSSENRNNEEVNKRNVKENRFGDKRNKTHDKKLNEISHGISNGQSVNENKSEDDNIENICMDEDKENIESNREEKSSERITISLNKSNEVDESNKYNKYENNNKELIESNENVTSIDVTEENINNEKSDESTNTEKTNESNGDSKATRNLRNFNHNEEELESTSRDRFLHDDLINERKLEESSQSHEDFLLRKAFMDEENISDLQEHKNPFENEEFQRSLGLDHLLTTTILPIVQSRYLEMGKMLLKSLADEYHLRQQLNVFISIILLDSNVYMNEFYSYVFNKINNKELLEEGDLSQNLQFCVGLTNPDLASHFGITLRMESEPEASSTSSKQSTEDILSSIRVEFTDLWPLSIIVKETHLVKYNNIFKFCLMLKRASYTVERLHFKEIASFDSCYKDDSSINISCDDESQGSQTPEEETIMPLAQRIHRLQLLRQWVLYFARILRDHFCNAIFLPFSLKVEELLGEKHFTDFKKEHDTLLNDVCHDCLLDEEKLSPIQITLMQLFSTVERIHQLWVGSMSHITEVQLSLLEDQYSSCHRLMATFLTTLASVRYCPSVEGLAQCLTYNYPAN